MHVTTCQHDVGASMLPAHADLPADALRPANLPQPNSQRGVRDAYCFGCGWRSCLPAVATDNTMRPPVPACSHARVSAAGAPRLRVWRSKASLPMMWRCWAIAAARARPLSAACTNWAGPHCSAQHLGRMCTSWLLAVAVRWCWAVASVPLYGG